MDDRNKHELVTAADRVEEVARQAAHTALNAGPTPGPIVYDTLGGMKLAVSRLADMVTGLSRSLAAAPQAFNLREDDGRDPLLAISLTVAKLDEARATADTLIRDLDKAQSAIGRQSYTSR